jgi:DNA-binding transcriptional ArsR family regulator
MAISFSSFLYLNLPANKYIYLIASYITLIIFAQTFINMKNNDLDVVKLEAAASKLRAMAHPMRIAIIDLLKEEKKMSVTQIYERLDIEQAAASHHLNILKTKGVLVSKREGKMIHYSLKNKALTDIIYCINKCHGD